MGAQGADILLSTAALKVLPISIECKSRNAIAVYAWMEQAQENCSTGLEPVLIVKQNYSNPLAIVDAEYFFKLLEKE